MADETMSREEATQAFDALMSQGTEAEYEASLQDQPESSQDELVEEMRGADDGANDEPSSEAPQTEENAELDTPGELLEKLRKAQKDAGKAGWKVNEERKAREAAESEIQQLRQRLEALESGQPTAQANQQSQAQADIVKLEGSQLDQFMSHFDDNWEENKDDPYLGKAGQYAANIVMSAVQSLRQEMAGVMGGVQNMQFNQRLEKLGIDRAQFDSVRQDPAYSWGSELSDEKFLAALETQAGRMGSSPSQHGVPSQGGPSAQGAQPTSRVNPRTIETSQPSSAGSNPIRMRDLRIQEAMKKGDTASAQEEARALFGQLMGQ